MLLPLISPIQAGLIDDDLRALGCHPFNVDHYLRLTAFRKIAMEFGGYSRLEHYPKDGDWIQVGQDRRVVLTCSMWISPDDAYYSAKIEAEQRRDDGWVPVTLNENKLAEDMRKFLKY